LILVLASLLFAAVVWSFFGQAPVVVTAQGVVDTEGSRFLVHTPAKGQLVDIYVAEDMPVSQGDVLFRVDAPQAVQIALQATEAELGLIEAQGQIEHWPAQKAHMQRMIDATAAKIREDTRELERVEAESIANLTEQQRIRLQKAQGKLEKARTELDYADDVFATYRRLFNSEGGGGISQQQVDEKRKIVQGKQLDYELARAELGEFEGKMSEEFYKKQIEIEEKRVKLAAGIAQYEQQLVQIEKEEEKILGALRQAQARVRTRITLGDIDGDNLLSVRAPTDGVVATVAHTRPGAIIEDKDPIVTIVPRNARKILQVQISEQDRAFLETGMPVKIKINAFPYQRYGYLTGTLEHISPTATFNQQSKKLVYSARVGLDEEHFRVNEDTFEVRFGMGARVEITVRKRRIIDIAIDPLRQTVG
jgi:HlyD family secretion protein